MKELDAHIRGEIMGLIRVPLNNQIVSNKKIDSVLVDMDLDDTIFNLWWDICLLKFDKVYGES